MADDAARAAYRYYESICGELDDEDRDSDLTKELIKIIREECPTERLEAKIARLRQLHDECCIFNEDGKCPALEEALAATEPD